MAAVEPLPHEWMIASIIGFFVSWLFIYGELGQTSVSFMRWGVAFMIFFVLMFLATIVNMSRLGLDDEHLEVLKIHERKR